MGQRSAARPGDRGGESIPALRTDRLRLGASVAALLAGAALAAYPVLVAGELLPVVATLGGLALLCTLVAILFRRFLGVGLVLFGAAYVVVDVTGGGASAASTLPYAVGLIVMAELILFAAELPRGGRADGSLLTSSLLVLAAVAVAAALLGLVVLAATTVRLSAGFEATLAGGASALALLALPLLLGRRNVPDGAAGYY